MYLGNLIYRGIQPLGKGAGRNWKDVRVPVKDTGGSGKESSPSKLTDAEHQLHRLCQCNREKEKLRITIR